jgi:hypothetical protein
MNHRGSDLIQPMMIDLVMEQVARAGALTTSGHSWRTFSLIKRQPSLLSLEYPPVNFPVTNEVKVRGKP